MLGRAAQRQIGAKDEMVGASNAEKGVLKAVARGSAMSAADAQRMRGGVYPDRSTRKAGDGWLVAGEAVAERAPAPLRRGRALQLRQKE